jgi:hypothetical protein
MEIMTTQALQCIVFWAAVSGLAVGSSAAQDRLSALIPAVEEIRKELALDDEQVSRAAGLVNGQMKRVTAAVESFGGISFDSILDLMVEARAARDEFIPAIRAILTDEQKAKLAKLPKAHGIYTSAVAGWLTEAQLGKLKGRIGLTDAQVPQVRSALLEQYKSAATIVEGLIRKPDDTSLQETVLDAVVDLRAAQRTAEREIKIHLTDAQKAQFESYRDESTKKSREKSEK